MSTNVTRFAKMNGYSKIKKVSAHSFRSGFLASAIFNNNLQSNNMETVITNVAIVAGWQLSGNFLNTYVQFETRKMIIANNIVNYSETSRPIVSEITMDPFFRHNNKISVAVWDTNSKHNYNYESFQAEINVHFNLENLNEKNNFWTHKIWGIYVYHTPSLKSHAESLYEDLRRKKRDIDREIGKKHLLELINKNDENIFKNLVEQFKKYKGLISYAPKQISESLELKKVTDYTTFKAAVSRLANLSEGKSNEKQNFWTFAERKYVEETRTTLDYERADPHDKARKTKSYVKTSITNIIKDNTDELVIENLIKTFADYKVKFIERKTSKTT